MQIPLLLDRARADTLTSQIVMQLRDAIGVGRIVPGTRLPSSRRLSEQLGIGRNTVVRAYEVLLMECCVEARPASGIFVAQRALPAPPPSVTARSAMPVPPALAHDVVPARSGHSPSPSPSPSPSLSLSLSLGRNRNRISFDFCPDSTSASLFPLKTWRRLLQSCLSHGGAAALCRPGDPSGLPALRSAIALHLAQARGVVADPAQIVIVGGIQEGISLAARVFLTQDTIAAVEDPCHSGAARAFAAAGAELRSIPVDEDGLRAEELPETHIALLHLTPSHQYPTGHTLSLARRHAVIAWARRHGCYILEDDRNSDFRYEGSPLQAIAALAPDCTIHLGSFSRSLGNGLRLGYMVLPPALVETVQRAKALLDGGNAWLDQAALAELIRGGSYAAHLMRIRAVYRASRDCLLMALRRHFGEVETSGEAGGLHLFWQLPPGVPDAASVERLGQRARVGVYSLGAANTFQAAPSALSRRGLILGYAALSPRQIEQGIARLSDAIDDALDGHYALLDTLLADRPTPRRAPLPVNGKVASARKAGQPAPRFRQQPALLTAAPRRALSRALRQRESADAMPVVTGLYRYPVKGLSAQPVASVRLEAGRPFPFDRVFALARPGRPIDPDDPKWAKKGLFVMLMLDEALARVSTHLDPDTLRLDVTQDGQQLLSANLGEAADRAKVERFFHRLVPALSDTPRLVRSRDGHFMDKPDNVLSLINLATVRRLSEQWGYAIDQFRFRANFYIDGAAPWEEFAWIGGEVRIGSAVFRVDRRNGRCGATNVNPANGQRDLDIPGSLRTAFGHKDLGVYLLTTGTGSVSVGDTVAVPSVDAPVPVIEARAPVHHRSFMCRGCYFVYEETRGRVEEAIAPGTAFADISASWRCPDCGGEKALFRPYVAAG